MLFILFLRQALPLAWDSLIKSGWLTGSLQPVCLLRAGIASAFQHTWLLVMVLRTNERILRLARPALQLLRCFPSPPAKGSRPSDFPVGTVKASCKSMIPGGIPHTDHKALAFISRLQVSSGLSKDAWRDKVRTMAGRTRLSFNPNFREGKWAL